MIQKFNDFYLLDNKLLYVCDDFIGYNPIITKGLDFEKMTGHDRKPTFGTKVKVDKFEIDDEPFTAILISFLYSGPLRGYKRIEILKNGHSIINYESGGYARVTNYKKGNQFFINNNKAYFIADGQTLKDSETGKFYEGISPGNNHLFLFENIVIPMIQDRNPVENSLSKNGTYYKEEIEFLRQTDWTAEAIFNDQKFNFSKSSVLDFGSTPYGKYKKEKGKRVLDKVHVTLNVF
ncbi:MAG: hypothetical protein ABI091_03025 [Ferruginibacter sp.]